MFRSSRSRSTALTPVPTLIPTFQQAGLGLATPRTGRLAASRGPVPLIPRGAAPLAFMILRRRATATTGMIMVFVEAELGLNG